MPGAVESIANAITEGFKLLKAVLDTAEVRRMRKAIDAGEQYILVKSEDGQYEGITPERKKKLLAHFRKRFFHYNN